MISASPRFSGQSHRQMQLKLNYDKPGKPPELEVNENVMGMMPTKATTIVWMGSSFKVGRMFVRRALRNYMIPTIQFVMKRRIF